MDSHPPSSARCAQSVVLMPHSSQARDAPGADISSAHTDALRPARISSSSWPSISTRAPAPRRSMRSSEAVLAPRTRLTVSKWTPNSAETRCRPAAGGTARKSALKTPTCAPKAISSRCGACGPAKSAAPSVSVRSSDEAFAVISARCSPREPAPATTENSAAIKSRSMSHLRTLSAGRSALQQSPCRTASAASNSSVKGVCARLFSRQ